MGFLCVTDRMGERARGTGAPASCARASVVDDFGGGIETPRVVNFDELAL